MRLSLNAYELRRMAEVRGIAREQLEQAVTAITAGKHLVITGRADERSLQLAEALCSLASARDACIGSLILREGRVGSPPFAEVVTERFLDRTWLVVTDATSSTLVRTTEHIRARRPSTSWRAILVSKSSARSLVTELGDGILETFFFIAVR